MEKQKTIRVKTPFGTWWSHYWRLFLVLLPLCGVTQLLNTPTMSVFFTLFWIAVLLFVFFRLYLGFVKKRNLKLLEYSEETYHKHCVARYIAYIAAPLTMLSYIIYFITMVAQYKR